MITIDTSIGVSAIQERLWESARQLQLPIALWRLPQSETVHLIIDLSGPPQQQVLNLEELPSGFAFSPFRNEFGNNFFIAAHLHYTFTGGDWQEEVAPLSAGLLATYEALQTQLRKNSDGPVASMGDLEYQPPEEVSQAIEKEQFEDLVRRAVGEIERGRFLKVVLSRAKRVELDREPDLVAIFSRLMSSYPDAFVSMVCLPGAGTWMGASPEILVSLDKDQVFRTMALAGTQPVQPGILPHQASWTQKEIEEQALVSRYIINCFKKIRVREFEEDGPKTVVAGNLMHLRTDFRAHSREVGFPQLGTIMLSLLHPTSAVCGMPKEPALAFIGAYEGYERSFYSGFLGPVNVDGESHLYVNLRCMQWWDRAAVIYAGAGVTAHSVPEKEWRETELKCQTMLHVIGKKR